MTEGTWLECSVSGNGPGKRYGAATCRVDNKIYVYGGALEDNGNVTYYQDLFLLTPNGSQVGSVRVSTSGVEPGPRTGAHLALFQGFIYLFGGTCNEWTLEHCRGIYKLDISSLTWYQVELQGDPCVVSHSMSIHGSKMFLFGGVGDDIPLNSLYSLNLRDAPLKWEEVETKGTPPGARVDHCSVVADNRLFVFGGSASHNHWYNDLHSLDLKTLTWSEHKVSSGILPPPSDYNTLSVCDNNYLVLFGGSNDSLAEKYFNDVWYYSISSNSWYRSDVLGEKPSPRYFSSAVLLAPNLLYIIAGVDTKSLEDIWVLQIHTNSLRGRELPNCKIENPPPPVTKFEIQGELPMIPPLTNFELPEVDKHTGLDKLKESVIGQITKGFGVLEAEYAAMYGAKQRFEREKLQLIRAKEEQETWLKEQRDDLVRQCEEHTARCTEWAELQTVEFSQERKLLGEERKRLERAQRRIAADQDTLNKRIKKLEELMNRAKIK